MTAVSVITPEAAASWCDISNEWASSNVAAFSCSCSVVKARDVSTVVDGSTVWDTELVFAWLLGVNPPSGERGPLIATSWVTVCGVSRDWELVLVLVLLWSARWVWVSERDVSNVSVCPEVAVSWMVMTGGLVRSSPCWGTSATRGLNRYGSFAGSNANFRISTESDQPSPSVSARTGEVP
jgi:hypothetical protein